ncbi:hypothetical protein KSP39_PZI007463 [Platanthera zijinensis]|uniref:Uncharacterized protein n=1 Tax=Platanthera zijinensis TaxID=2320716 RepID=A0AAP0BQZ8_9ASPA
MTATSYCSAPQFSHRDRGKLCTIREKCEQTCGKHTLKRSAAGPRSSSSPLKRVVSSLFCPRGKITHKKKKRKLFFEGGYKADHQAVVNSDNARLSITTFQYPAPEAAVYLLTVTEGERPVMEAAVTFAEMYASKMRGDLELPRLKRMAKLETNNAPFRMVVAVMAPFGTVVAVVNAWIKSSFGAAEAKAKLELHLWRDK